MIKKFILPVIASLFIFVGCSIKNNEATEEKNNPSSLLLIKIILLLIKKYLFLVNLIPTANIYF